MLQKLGGARSGPGQARTTPQRRVGAVALSGPACYFDVTCAAWVAARTRPLSGTANEQALDRLRALLASESS